MNADFYFENLDEFRAKLDGIAGAYTETAEKHLKRAGNKLRKLAAENTPVSGVERMTRKGKKAKPISHGRVKLRGFPRTRFCTSQQKLDTKT